MFAIFIAYARLVAMPETGDCFYGNKWHAMRFSSNNLLFLIAWLILV